MSNQYEVLGKALGVKDIQNLSPSNVHLTIKNLLHLKNLINQKTIHLQIFIILKK